MTRRQVCKGSLATLACFVVGCASKGRGLSAERDGTSTHRGRESDSHGLSPKARAYKVCRVPVYQEVWLNPVEEVAPHRFVARDAGNRWIWIYQEPLWRDSSLSYCPAFGSREEALLDLARYSRDEQVRDRRKWLAEPKRSRVASAG